MAGTATTRRFTASVRAAHAATLLTMTGLFIAARYSGMDQHTGIFMSGIALGVVPVLQCMQCILCIEGRRMPCVSS